jgi:tetraacyldisaccharide 4'-kinase
MRTISPAFASVIYFPGLIYEALIRLRGSLYSAAVLPQHSLPAPVISIGNITVGGSGKTPLVIYVAQVLLRLGGNPVLLSRGYGRRRSSASWILPPGKTVPSPARMLGDEPALVRRHIPSLWMGISKNRLRVGNSIAKHEMRTVFLLDDGFQHRKLRRNLDIVIIDRSQPLRANRLLPRGTLREPISELRRCHLVMINGLLEKKETIDPLEEEIRKLNAQAMIFHCKQTIRSLIPYSSWNEGQEHCRPNATIRSAYLVSALGNPERFHRDIQQLGIEVRGAKSFPDHYWLKQKDWLACVSEARSKTVDTIIITEKDAIKISQPPDFPLMVSIQSTEISDAPAFELVLKNCIERNL